MTQQRLFILIRAALTDIQSGECHFSEMTVEEWGSLLAYCSNQGLVAVAFAGIERLHIKPPKAQLLYWFRFAEYVKT